MTDTPGCWAGGGGWLTGLGFFVKENISNYSKFQCVFKCRKKIMSIYSSAKMVEGLCRIVMLSSNKRNSESILVLKFIETMFLGNVIS